MFSKNKILYNLDDVAIMPSDTSYINHRSSCNVYYINEYMLPIFTAPMPCVVNKETIDIYKANNIIPILPRTEEYTYRINSCDKNWCAFSLQEFKEIFCNEYDKRNYKRYVLIDIANGNMYDLMKSIKVSKEIHNDNIVIMAGNVANPETYRKLSECGADYVRLSVGSGTGCTSATNLGIFYPMASLIDECHYIKTHIDGNSKGAKIIADGGLSNYRNMIKALALGADYIMLGSALNKCSDSAGEIVKIEDGSYKKLYYGMASLIGQKKLGKKEEKTPEGKIVYNEISGTIKDFSIDFKAYLSSAMSYCNINSISDFIGKPIVNVISNNSSKQFNQKQ